MKSTEIKEYLSPKDFMNSLDEDINEMRKILAENLRKLEEMRRRVDQQKMIRQIVQKLFPQYKFVAPKNVVELRDTQIVIGPTIEQEIESLERVLDLINHKLNILISIRKELEVLTQYKSPLKIIAFYIDGIPKIIHIVS